MSYAVIMLYVDAERCPEDLVRVAADVAAGSMRPSSACPLWASNRRS